MSTISAGTTSTTTLQVSGDTTGSLVIKTNDTGSGGTTAITVDTSQNVGIGTTNSNAFRLAAVGGRLQLSGGTTSQEGIAIQRVAGAATITGINNDNNTYNPISFYTSGSEAMRIDSSGNVGIGTGSPSGKLNVSDGTVIGEINPYSAASGCYIGTRSNHAILFEVNASEKARINTGGGLLVGCTANPSASVEGRRIESGSGATVSSSGSLTSAYSHWTFFNGNGNVGTIQTSASATSYNTSSDYRLKHDIAPMIGALAKVQALKPCTYKWNADNSQGEGFIAHELAEVVPGCVTGEKDAVDAEGNPVYQGIDTSFLVATLTAAIQELKAELDATKAEIAALKGA